MNTFPKSHLEKIKELIVEGDTEQAAKLLAEATKDKQLGRFHLLAISLNSRINKLEEKTIKRTISQEDEEIGWNQITDSMLELLEQMESHLSEKKAEPVVPVEKKEEKHAEQKRPPTTVSQPEFQPAWQTSALPAPPNSRKKSHVLLFSIAALAVLAFVGILVFPDSKKQEPVSTRVRGTVTYYDKNPGIMLQLEFDDGKAIAYTDQDGYFQVDLPKAMDDYVFLVVKNRDGNVLTRDSFLVSNLESFAVPYYSPKF